MTATAPSSTSFAYIESDIPDGQTLVEWRRDRIAARRAERPVRRTVRLTRLRRLRWAT